MASHAEAAAPAYLQTAKGTVALIASASGLIAPGGRATPERPGVNELRVEAGDRENEATDDLPGAPANTPDPEDSRRILQSIRDARQRADLRSISFRLVVLNNIGDGQPDVHNAYASNEFLHTRGLPRLQPAGCPGAGLNAAHHRQRHSTAR